MKLAKVGDYKRKLSNAMPRRGILHVEFSGSKKLRFYLLNSVCGLNGSGKTRFLKAIAEGGNVEFEGISVVQEGAKTLYINPSLWVNESLLECNNYKSAGDFKEVLDSYDPIAFDAESMGDVNYILQSGFKHIELYSIEKLGGKVEERGADNFSYCLASKAGVELSSLSLSHGELYVILLVGLLSNLDEYDALLIDEAEAFLSPVAQTRLANVLLKRSVEPREGNTQIIVATHSPFMLDAIGYENSFTMERAVSGLKFDSANKKILDTIGLSTSIQNVLLFEDSKAKRLTEYLLDRCLPAWQHANIAIALGGESDMRSVKSMVSDAGKNKIILVFDADIASKSPLRKGEGEYSLLLPGTLSPEEEFIGIIKEKPLEFMRQFGKYDKARLDVALSNCDAIDHHDFFCELSKQVNINEFELFRKAFDVWFEFNKDDCERFAREFSSLIV